MSSRGDPVAVAADRFGDEVFAIEGERTMSFRQLEEDVEQAAAALRSEPGERVGQLAPQSIAGFVSLLAHLRAGAVVCLIPHRLTPSGRRSLAAAWGVGRVTGTPARLVFPTSGTTGQPKGVVHDWNTLMASAEGACLHLQFRPGCLWGMVLPTHHVGGLAPVFRALASGGGVFVPADRRALPETAVRVTHLSVVATQLTRLLEEKSGRCAPGLRCLLTGGGPMPSGLVGRAVEMGWPIVRSYGLTEMGSLVTAGRPGETVGSGRVLPRRDLRIDASGEIQVGGDALFLGYLDGPPPRDWHPTGDLGAWDSAGRLHVVGRKDNMFISGGENVHPERIEEVLLELEGITDAYAVPVEDGEFGARPVAFLEGSWEADAVHVHLAARLPGFLRPASLHALPAPSPGEAMKRSRRRLIELAGRLEEQRINNGAPDADTS